MSHPRLTVLVVGATGSIGRLVVEEAVRKGYAVRVLVRDSGTPRRLFPGVEVVVGDLTRPDTLTAAWRRRAASPQTSNTDTPHRDTAR